LPDEAARLVGMTDGVRRRLSADLKKIQQASRADDERRAKLAAEAATAWDAIGDLAKEFASIMRAHGAPGAERRYKLRTVWFVGNVKQRYGRLGWYLERMTEYGPTEVKASPWLWVDDLGEIDWLGHKEDLRYDAIALASSEFAALLNKHGIADI
jgi:hypothetical protein